MIARVLFALLFWPASLWAQGYAGLGTTAEGFDLPRQGKELTFPEDHGPHPDFRIEWWYLTANLHAEDSREFGVQWTLFRSALRPGDEAGWQSPQIWMAHAAVTSAQIHLSDESFARGGIGQAGVTVEPFSAWINDWSLRSRDAGFENLSVTATSEAFSYTLDLSAQGPLVLHGDQGYSVKSPEGQASYYYSQPKFSVKGTLRIKGQDVRVTGNAWLDREWSSQPLSERQTGWDWFSLSLDDGAQLMGFVLRSGDSDFTSGTYIAPNGSTRALAPGEFSAVPLQRSAVKGRRIPTQWRLTLPSESIDITVEALNELSWMDLSFAYWEGPVQLSGSHSGRGYLEMTGYPTEQAAD